jgi:hypothetical protein
MVSEPTLVVAHTGQCADIGRMARVSLRWNTRHGVWVGTGRVSWTDEDVLSGVNVTPDPIWMAHEWLMSARACV